MVVAAGRRLKLVLVRKHEMVVLVAVEPTLLETSGFLMDAVTVFKAVKELVAVVAVEGVALEQSVAMLLVLMLVATVALVETFPFGSVSPLAQPTRLVGAAVREVLVVQAELVAEEAVVPLVRLTRVAVGVPTILAVQELCM